jgi:hypothetical protein
VTSESDGEQQPDHECRNGDDAEAAFDADEELSRQTMASWDTAPRRAQARSSDSLPAGS